MKLSKISGISMIELTIAMGLLVGIAFTSSYFLTSTNVLKKKEMTKATIDQIHILQVQRAKNSQTVRDFMYQDGTGILVDAERLKCFNGSRERNDCASLAGIPQTWGTAIAIPPTFTVGGNSKTGFLDSSTTLGDMFGEADLFQTEAVLKANCCDGGAGCRVCKSVDIRITTQVRIGSSLAPTAPERKLEPRVSTINIPSHFLVARSPIRFNTAGCAGFIATTLKHDENRADCTAFSSAAETSCSGYSMVNFGDGRSASTCAAPQITDCSIGVYRGYVNLKTDMLAGDIATDCRHRP